MRREPFEIGSYYHVYNRGTDKRAVFLDNSDIKRFLQDLSEFNTEDPVGSIHFNSFKNRKLSGRTTKLVDVVAYCLIPNHFHLILKEVREGGISEFMKRVSGGYSRYFNTKRDRSGVLFQGKFKSSLIKNYDRLLELSAYVNLNYKIHKLSGRTTKLVRSSFEEYTKEELGENSICSQKEIRKILKNFKTKDSYKKFSEKTVRGIIGERRENKGLDKMLID